MIQQKRIQNGDRGDIGNNLSSGALVILLNWPL